MQNLTNQQIDFYADLLATSFMDYPRNIEISKGLNNPHEFFKNTHKIQLQEFMKEDMLYLLDTRGIFIGFRSKEKSILKIIYIFWKMNRAIKKSTDKQTIKKVVENEKRIKPVDQYSWYRKYANVKDYFYIMDLAISKDAQGTGALRQLLTPILEKNEQLNLPTVLETHSLKNVKIYEHFGFEVVHVFEDKTLPYKQWCLVKYPKKK